jgi:hypothetical protein
MWEGPERPCSCFGDLVNVQQLHSHHTTPYTHTVVHREEKSAAAMATSVGKFRSASGKLWEVSQSIEQRSKPH